MLFNSIQFLIFFPLVVFFYYLLPFRFRWILLLGGSYYFYYTGQTLYIFVLLFSTGIDYVIGLRMGKTTDARERKYFLILSIFCNVGLLVVFKYLSFFGRVFNEIGGLFGFSTAQPVQSGGLDLAVPLGISYYTFKKMSYIIDIYRENREPERHAGVFALYVSFFPQVVAGPIDRAKNLLHQFKEKHTFQYDNVVGGLKLVAWGMFKKLVVADRLALFVAPVFKDPSAFPGITLTAATVMFSFQVYADFSGYTDMAVGLARVMGYRCAENFDRPYFSVSITDFWRRWHITLTTWLRDYLFLPIAYSVSRCLGNKSFQSKIAQSTAPESHAYVWGVLATMLLCGLWHGPSWTFVLWGTFHGVYLALSFVTRKKRKKLRKALLTKRGKRRALKKIYRAVRVLVTFSIVTFLWIFFAARSVGDAVYIVQHMFSGWGDWSVVLTGQPLGELMLAFAGILVMLVTEKLQTLEQSRNLFSEKPQLVRWAVYVFWLLAIMNFGVFHDVPFIYARF